MDCPTDPAHNAPRLAAPAASGRLNLTPRQRRRLLMDSALRNKHPHCGIYDNPPGGSRGERKSLRRSGRMPLANLSRRHAPGTDAVAAPPRAPDALRTRIQELLEAYGRIVHLASAEVFVSDVVGLLKLVLDDQRRSPSCSPPIRPTASRSIPPGATASTTPWVPPRRRTCDRCE